MATELLDPKEQSLGPMRWASLPMTKELPMPQAKPRARKPGAHVAYRDIFGVRDARKGPLVLADCTSVEWPKGWTKADAAIWRKANRLSAPSGE